MCILVIRNQTEIFKLSVAEFIRLDPGTLSWRCDLSLLFKMLGDRGGGGATRGAQPRDCVPPQSSCVQGTSEAAAQRPSLDRHRGRLCVCDVQSNWWAWTYLACEGGPVTRQERGHGMQSSPAPSVSHEADLPHWNHDSDRVYQLSAQFVPFCKEMIIWGLKNEIKRDHNCVLQSLGETAKTELCMPALACSKS